MLVLFGWLLCGGAWAQNNGDVNQSWQECNGPTVTPTSYVINVDVGRDAQVGDAVGQWFEIERFRWDCNLRSDNHPFVLSGSAKVQVLAAGTNYPVWGTSNPDEFSSQPQTVFLLNQNGQEIGFIARLLYPFDFFWSSHRSISYFAEFDDGGFGFDWPSTRPNGQHRKHEAILQIKMVKVHNNFPNANSIFSINSFAKFVLHTTNTKHVFHNDGGDIWPDGYWSDMGYSWEQHAEHIISGSVQVNIFASSGTCTTPSAYVDLGQRAINDLPYDNDSAGQQMADFSVVFHNCPPHMAGVKYNLLSVPSGYPVSNGVLPLISPSTATGVGVQVFHKDVISGGSFIYQPININQTYFIYRTNNPYGNTSSYGRLSARMVRSGSGISPTAGTVHAALKVVATYH